MKTEKRLSEIFAAAIDLDQPEERESFLEKACGGNPEIRSKVDELIDAHEKSGEFLETPIEYPELTRANDSETDSIETNPQSDLEKIGPYRIVTKLGEGGMGVVLLAEQTEPFQRQVAVKLIKTGMGNRQVISRFEAERQALALMDHPNIASVFDAGTTEKGAPYFVMEYVPGQPITSYCDEHRLDINERLELFVQVCKAIHHAHEKKIIHRDIKPSNVLVITQDGIPVPKIIDFGVAKAIGLRLTEQSIVTVYGQIIGTLEYMSPEQASSNGGQIDSRSDVYSLGVLLYELLTGTPPFSEQMFQRKGIGEILRIIREEKPLKPSDQLAAAGDRKKSVAFERKSSETNLTNLIRGELDSIAIKSLEKDRSYRYGSALDFANDIENYLNGDFVSARPPTGLNRFAKFARHNQSNIYLGAVVVLLIAVIVLSIVAGNTLNSLSRTRALLDDQRNQAEQLRKRNESLEQSLLIANARPTWNPARFPRQLINCWYVNGEHWTYGINDEYTIRTANRFFDVVSVTTKGDLLRIITRYENRNRYFVFFFKDITSDSMKAYREPIASASNFDEILGVETLEEAEKVEPGTFQSFCLSSKPEIKARDTSLNLYDLIKYRTMRTRESAESCNWKGAADFAWQAYKLRSPLGPQEWAHTAIFLALDGRAAEFKKLISDYQEKGQIRRLHYLTRLNMLVPNAFDEQQQLVGTANEVVKRVKAQGIDSYWYEFVKGCTIYRSGNFELAKKEFLSLKSDNRANEWINTMKSFLLAMTCFQLGQKGDAKQWLDKAESLCASEPGHPVHVKRFQLFAELELIRREATTLITGKQPPSLKESMKLRDDAAF